MINNYKSLSSVMSFLFDLKNACKYVTLHVSSVIRTSSEVYSVKHFYHDKRSVNISDVCQVC
jgi:hypothetical protein